MKTLKLNRAQNTHLAALIDKLSLAYCAAVGAVAWLNNDYLFAAHAVVVFAIMQAAATYLLR